MFATATKQKSNRTTIKLPPTIPWKLKRGHQSHRGGSGTHGDRRLRRLRTRADQRWAALEE